MSKEMPYIVLEHPNFGPLVLIIPKRKPDALSEVNPQAPLPPHSPARALNELLASPRRLGYEIHLNQAI